MVLRGGGVASRTGEQANGRTGERSNGRRWEGEGGVEISNRKKKDKETHGVSFFASRAAASSS